MAQDKAFPEVSAEAWRAQVEKELAGVSFEKALTLVTPEGLTVQPLYVDASGLAPANVPGAAPFVRGAHPVAETRAWTVCSRVAADAQAVREEIEGGATALWVQVARGQDVGSAKAAIAGVPADVPVLLDVGAEAALGLAAIADGSRVQLAVDPIGERAKSGADAAGAADVLASLAKATPGRVAVVDTLAYHGAGASAAEELGFALSTGVAYLRALEHAGLEVSAAAARIGFRVAVGRDTFAELAKLRALRLVWHKALAAAGAPDAPLAHLHATCSPRTLSQRDPWVNMLRVTTEVFAAILGGADAVTPEPFDAALTAPGALGRRLARNTPLVLGHESYLGRVVDPAGGSYYLEQLTDGLARAAWTVFRELEREGGMAAALAAGSVRARCDASWKKRADTLAKRKDALTGVSEFAHLGETLPSAPARTPEGAPFPLRRDAAPFEALRDTADELAARGSRPRVALAPLGPLAEHKARATFAQNFFQAGGFAVDEHAEGEATATATAVCICGSDERYAAEAADRARALRAAGARRIYLAGRPAALEAELRDAGVDGHIFVGCDVVAVLRELHASANPNDPSAAPASEARR